MFLLLPAIPEGLCQLGTNNSLLGDFQSLEKGLVEQPPLTRIGLAVGRLHVFGQIERNVERLQHLLMFDAQLLDALLQPVPLAANPGLLLAEQVFAHLIGVMGLEELPFLAVQPGQLSPSLGELLVGLLGQRTDVGLHARPDACPLLIRKLHGRAVVLLDGHFNCRHPVIPLRAGALGAASADEILVGAAVAFGPHVDQPTTALRAKQTAPQVVEVPPGALAALALGAQEVLHVLEGARVDQRLMPSGIELPGVAHLPDVVGVAQ